MFFSFFTVTVCEKESNSKQLNFLENKDLVFEKNAPSLMYLKKQLMQSRVLLHATAFGVAGVAEITMAIASAECSLKTRG